MSRIAATFAQLAKDKRKALIPYITAGFPYADITPQLMHAMVEAGLSQSMAAMYVEMSQGFNEGVIQSVDGRSARNTTPTRFEDFAKQVLAPVYRAQ